MKAITTRYIGPTNYRGSRVKAYADGVPSLTMDYQHELSGEDVYRAAAEALRDREGWTGELLGGGLPDQSGYVFVFRPGDPDEDDRELCACSSGKHYIDLKNGRCLNRTRHLSRLCRDCRDLGVVAEEVLR